MPNSGFADWSQCTDRLAQQLVGLLAQASAARAPGRRPTGGTGSAPSVHTSCSSAARPGCLAISQGALSSMNLLARSASSHDRPHRPVEIAGFVGLGNLLAVRGGLRRTSPPSSGYLAARPVCRTNRAVRLARLTTLPTRSELTLVTNSSRFRSRSSTLRRQLRGVVVAQVGRVEMLQVGRRADERALASSTSSRR